MDLCVQRAPASVYAATYLRSKFPLARFPVTSRRGRLKRLPDAWPPGQPGIEREILEYGFVRDPADAEAAAPVYTRPQTQHVG
jgi:hypothetical protein